MCRRAYENKCFDVSVLQDAFQVSVEEFVGSRFDYGFGSTRKNLFLNVRQNCLSGEAVDDKRIMGPGLFKKIFHFL